jgi:hypothetical protein
MSNSTKASLRADLWFQEYLALGERRSLRTLAAEAQRICSANGWDHIPSERAFFDWSSKYGWDQRAKLHDKEVMYRAEEQLRRKHAKLAGERADLALEHSMAFHSLVENALTIETPCVDKDGQGNPQFKKDGSVKTIVKRRPAKFRELSKQDVLLTINLHKTAMATDQILLAGAFDRYQESQEQRGEDLPGNVILGPSAIQEMDIMIDGQAKTLSEVPERRNAKKPLEIVQRNSEVDGSVPVNEQNNPDNPGLGREEVEDDDEVRYSR